MHLGKELWVGGGLEFESWLPRLRLRRRNKFCAEFRCVVFTVDASSIIRLLPLSSPPSPFSSPSSLAFSVLFFFLHVPLFLLLFVLLFLFPLSSSSSSSSTRLQINSAAINRDLNLGAAPGRAQAGGRSALPDLFISSDDAEVYWTSFNLGVFPPPLYLSPWGEVTKES